VRTEPENLTPLITEPENLTPLITEPENLTPLITEPENLTPLITEPENLTPLITEPDAGYEPERILSTSDPQNEIFMTIETSYLLLGLLSIRFPRGFGT
jgi:hypothetical protein